MYDESDSIAWIPGENFDPHDPDEMEIMHHIWEGDRMRYMERLENENARLRGLVEEMNEKEMA